jgi:AraC-like DNA-binding protein
MLEDLKIAKEYDGLLFLAESTRNPPRLKSHHHVELELNLVVRGNITYVVGEHRFTFPARTLLWLFPEQEHQLVDTTDDSQNYVAVFKPSLIRRSCHTPLYQGLRQDHNEHHGVLNTLLEPESFDLIRKTMDSLMPGSLDADLLNHEAGFGVGSGFSFAHSDPDGLNAGLHHMLLLCWRSHRSGRALGEEVPLHPAVRRTLKILSEDQDQGNLATLAKRCNVSEPYLSRTFHRQLGVPLTRYRNSLRLSRFWEAYREGVGINLAEAAYDAGFGSYAQFYKVFAQTYGHGPKACLEENAAVRDSKRKGG